MKPPVEEVKISSQGKEKLIAINRRFGFDQWNTPARLAFIIAIKSEFKGFSRIDYKGSSIEMTWRTFAGPYDAILTTLALGEIARLRVDHKDLSDSQIFHELLHQGIMIMSNRDQLPDLSSLISEKILR